MEQVKEKISKAQLLFKERMIAIQEQGGLTRERYIRFLTCQYHLTKGVQRHFYRIAAHSSLARKKPLRDWLVQFAREEEFHFDIAKKDLEQLDSQPLECPFDVALWWLYFDSVVDERPYIRLGGTCILENISNTSSEVIDQSLATSDFLTAQNTRFLTIHRHGPNLDHGNEIINNLEASQPDEDELRDLELGCEYATSFYLRFMSWMMTGEISK